MAKKRCFTVQSGPPQLVACNPPVIISQPVAQSVQAGGNASFAVTVTGTAPFNYQWYKDNVAIGGATSATLNLTNINSGNVGSYKVIINNACDMPATSNPVSLSIVTLITAYWLAMDTDPFPTLNGGTDPYSYPNSLNITHNSPIGFPVANSDVNRYFIFKVPVGESIKTHWYAAALNNGDIPDPAFRAPITIGSYMYYATRGTFTYDLNTTLTLS